MDVDITRIILQLSVLPLLSHRCQYNTTIHITASNTATMAITATVDFLAGELPK